MRCHRRNHHGSWLAVGDCDAHLRIVDARTGDIRAEFDGVVYGLSCVAVAPSGEWLAAGRAYDVAIWDVQTGRIRPLLTGHTDAVNAVVIASDGTWLASGSSDETVRIWDAETGHTRTALGSRKRKADHRGHLTPDTILALAVAPDGSWLAAGAADGTVRIWDVARHKLVTLFAAHRGPVRALAMFPDGTHLASGGADGLVRVWDMRVPAEEGFAKRRRWIPAQAHRSVR
jgi:WD40 repeat protein